MSPSVMQVSAALLVFGSMSRLERTEYLLEHPEFANTSNADLALTWSGNDQADLEVRVKMASAAEWIAGAAGDQRRQGLARQRLDNLLDES